MKDVSEGNTSMTLVLIISVVMSVFGGTFQYGYNIAVVNAPSELIKEYFFEGENNTVVNITNESSTLSPSNSSNITIAEVEETEYSQEETFLWAFTVSIFTVGGIIGSASVGFMSQKFGRKKGLLASNVLSLTGAILMYASKPANSIEMIIIARFLLGIFSGLATGMVPLYISEISPKHVRGALGVINQLAVTIGILTAQLLSLKEAFGTEATWNILLALTGVPSAVQLMILTFMPESPRYLLIDKQKTQAATNALIRLRGTTNVHGEIEEMEEEAEEQKDVEIASIYEVLRNDSIRWQIISISVLHACQQLCGINAVFFYLNAIFKAAGVEKDMRSYASCIVGGVNVFMTIISVFLTDRVGRKALIYVGYGIAGFFCLVMTISLELQETVSWVSNLSIASVIGFIIGFAIGPGPIPWIQQTEFFQQSNRPGAGSFATALNWTCNFIVALLFPFMQEFMGSYVFIFFCAICLIGCVFTFKYVPESKNKTFQEISVLFDRLNGNEKLGYDEVQMVDRQTY